MNFVFNYFNTYFRGQLKRTHINYYLVGLIQWLTSANLILIVGESSGKPPRTVAKHIPGLSNLEGNSQRACSEVSRAHQMVVERGDKLSQLEERTARMMNEADSFQQNAHSLMLKYKDKKWYQL